MDLVAGEALGDRAGLAAAQLGQWRVVGVAHRHAVEEVLLAVANEKQLAQPLERGQEGIVEIDTPDTSRGSTIGAHNAEPYPTRAIGSGADDHEATQWAQMNT